MKRGRRLGNIEKEVLTDLTSGDMLYGFLLSGRSTKRMFRLARERANHRYRRKLAIERLREDAYIKKEREGIFCITSNGERALGTMADKTYATIKAKVWDKKWRIVIYDIPQSLGYLRPGVRAVLKRSGFVKLQQSVWVFPHDCEELVQLMRTETQLVPYIIYGVLERIENEERLKKLFHL